MNNHTRLTDPRPASAKELRFIQHDIRRAADDLAELKAKMKLATENSRVWKDMLEIRLRRVEHLKRLQAERAEMILRLKERPLARPDLADVIERMTDVENVIVTEGYQSGVEALRAFIDYCVTDLERLDQMDDAAVLGSAATRREGTDD